MKPPKTAADVLRSVRVFLAAERQLHENADARLTPLRMARLRPPLRAARRAALALADELEELAEAEAREAQPDLQDALDGPTSAERRRARPRGRTA